MSPSLQLAPGSLLQNPKPLSRVRRRLVAAWTQACPAGGA